MSVSLKVTSLGRVIHPTVSNEARPVAPGKTLVDLRSPTLATVPW
jgi:hypothetical protein